MLFFPPLETAPRSAGTGSNQRRTTNNTPSSRDSATPRQRPQEAATTNSSHTSGSDLLDRTRPTSARAGRQLATRCLSSSCPKQRLSLCREQNSSYAIFVYTLKPFLCSVSSYFLFPTSVIAYSCGWDRSIQNAPLHSPAYTIHTEAAASLL